MYNEKKVVGWSLFILFLGMMIVYSLAYLKHSDLFDESLISAEISQTSNLASTGIATNESLSIPLVDFSGVSQNSLENNSGKDIIGSGTVGSSGSSLSSGEQDILSTSGGDTSHEDTTFLASPELIPLLPGTTQFFGVLDLLDTLGLKPHYILQNGSGMYFAYFGKDKLDFGRTVEQLGGNVYTMTTEKEILDNQLFGDKLSFINLKVFEHKYVFMVVEINKETWLLQIPYDLYYKSKAYVKSLFI